MHKVESRSPEPPLAAEQAKGRLGSRVQELSEEVDPREAAAMAAVIGDADRGEEARRDALSTLLMEAFRQHRGRSCFGLLYELNSQHLLVQVAGRLRRYLSKADPRDVLQEVFFNIYRYPHRFNAEREDAFRVWSAMIVRNTVLKHLRAQGRGGRTEVPFENLSDHAELRAASPLSGAIESESRSVCLSAYFLILDKYLKFYGRLSEREQLALHRVEVGERSYREAAAELGIKLENLKMVIFRARRKIFRAMRREFDGMSPDCRPAREPRAREGGANEADENASDEGFPSGHDAGTRGGGGSIR